MLSHILLAAVVICGSVRAAGNAGDGPLCSVPVTKSATYLNPKASINDRVADLLNRMCWDEKVAQIGGIGGLLGTNSTVNATQYQSIAQLHNGSISPGSYLNYADQAVPVLANLTIAAQKQDRLGIPYVNIGDGVNGVTLLGTTLFPATLSMSTSWNLPLYESVIEAMREEFYACGINWVLSPEVDAARDPRNGRVGEMYGEDPWLNSQYGTIFISTMQQNDASGFMKVAATMKHYLYGSSTGGVNEASLRGGPNHIYNELGRSYITVLQNVQPAAIMPSYGTVDGVPSHANSYLLQTIARRQFGFSGVVVSDADAIPQLYNTHKVASDMNDAAIKALGAGVQLELAVNFPTAFETLVGNSSIPSVVANVNEAVTRLLELKFRLGLFDKSLAANQTALEQVLRSPKNLNLSQEIARESIVLLKNDGILPIKPSTKIAVVGPFADVVNPGTYAAWTNADNGNKTFLDAVQARFGAENVDYVQGVDILDESLSDIDSAVAAAKNAGLVIAMLGALAPGWEDPLISQKTDGEGAAHATLLLPGLQQELLSALVDSGVPTIVVLSGGQAFELIGDAQRAGAILHGFLAGEYTASALVDVIVGDVNPSGKLTITFPYASEVNPVYYNREPSDWTGWGSITIPWIGNNYLYPFGYGLSYTTFNFSDVTLDKSSYHRGDTITVSVEVSNIGNTDGKEVVQVYFAQEVAALSLPVKRLVGTAKVDVAAGASTKVAIQVPVKNLGYWLDSSYTVDSGAYTLWVGDSSDSSDLSAALTITIS